MEDRQLLDALSRLSAEQRDLVKEFIAYLRWREQEGNGRSWYWADEWRRRFHEAQLAEHLD